MDWDLQAIVRGCTGGAETPASNVNMIHNLHLNYSQFFSKQDDDLFFDFLEFSETTAVVDELGELYKPFYPASNNNPIASSLPKETEQVKVLTPSNKVPVQQDLKDSAASKTKRSKKKKRVKQVTEAEGISDGWAWRKYGQKAIKGSPYPRSYYRCSSCKGCMARKQVERSHLDPQVFILNYTAEHKHPQPTRKNPQAGCTRKNGSTIIAPRVEQSIAELEEDLKGLDQQLALDGCSLICG